MDFGQKALERRGFAGVAQLVEQLICNQQVEGSSPPAGSRAGESGGSSFFYCCGNGEIPKRSTGADCKSVGFRLRRFESCSPHWIGVFKATKAAGVAQLVEHQPSKLRVAGSSLVSRSCLGFREEERGRCSSGVERFLGKEEVMSSILIIGSDGGKGSRGRQL